ncbi:unnamed protein product [Leuciscus chuanchicus]
MPCSPSPQTPPRTQTQPKAQIHARPHRLRTRTIRLAYLGRGTYSTEPRGIKSQFISQYRIKSQHRIKQKDMELEKTCLIASLLRKSENENATAVPQTRSELDPGQDSTGTSYAQPPTFAGTVQSQPHPPTAPQLSRHVLEFTPVNERVASPRLRVGDRSLTVVCAYGPNGRVEYPAFLGSLGGVLENAPTEDSVDLLGDFNAHMGSDSDTWRGVIGRNCPPDLNPSGVLLLDFYASYSLSIINTMFNYQCTCHQDTPGRRSMIDFVVVSSDLRPYVLDIWVKRGAELSTDHHLVVSWIR